MFDAWANKRILITVRTYPAPAEKAIEVSCTGGMTDEGRWIRLFPLPYRHLPQEKRFGKYQWVNIRVKKASDPRRESFNPDLDSIEVISERLPTSSKWQARKDIVYPLKAHCLCCLKAERDEQGFPTLGFFKPKSIDGLLIERDREEWTPEELAKLRRQTLFEAAPPPELERIPYKFRYSFQCDHSACTGHTMACTDWELGESYRKWRRKYGAEWERYFRLKYEDQMIHKNDTHFYVGTLHQRPATWIIVGLFYPRL